jgi:hypothetical protein
MGLLFSKPVIIKNKDLNESLLNDELKYDILKRLEMIEDKVWVIDNKLDKVLNI